MNLESFAIGIVTMVVFALAIATVIGMLKVVSITREVVKLKRRLEDDERELSREINMVEQTLRNQMNHSVETMHLVCNETERACTSYTDKRIDKLVDTYFDIKNAKKNLLKD
jgi:predicted Holliday junction resolvase-like endonuclease